MIDGVTIKTDTGCPHHDVVEIEATGGSYVYWCAVCGSIAMDANEPWRSPTGIVLPGWRCSACHAFNGDTKQVLTACRCCETPR